MITVLVPSCSSMAGLAEKWSGEIDIDAGTYVMVRQLNTGEWVVLKVAVGKSVVSDIETGRHGNGNSYEEIRSAFRQALSYEPDWIVLVLEGDVTLRYMEDPVLNHFGEDTFGVQIKYQPIPFPKHGY